MTAISNKTIASNASFLDLPADLQPSILAYLHPHATPAVLHLNRYTLQTYAPSFRSNLTFAIACLQNLHHAWSESQRDRKRWSSYFRGADARENAENAWACVNWRYMVVGMGDDVNTVFWTALMCVSGFNYKIFKMLVLPPEKPSPASRALVPPARRGGLAVSPRLIFTSPVLPSPLPSPLKFASSSPAPPSPVGTHKVSGHNQNEGSTFSEYFHPFGEWMVMSLETIVWSMERKRWPFNSPPESGSAKETTTPTEKPRKPRLSIDTGSLQQSFLQPLHPQWRLTSFPKTQNNSLSFSLLYAAAVSAKCPTLFGQLVEAFLRVQEEVSVTIFDKPLVTSIMTAIPTSITNGAPVEVLNVARDGIRRSYQEGEEEAQSEARNLFRAHVLENAAYHGRRDVVEWLLSSDTELSHQGDEFALTPWRNALWSSCANGHIEVVRMLLLYGNRTLDPTLVMDAVNHVHKISIHTRWSDSVLTVLDGWFEGTLDESGEKDRVEVC
ncbi:hypothetical protein HDU97_005659 [Phlyctochytrium planicorne]|nr:hypothetical protein HDU97_005659 [Phlyctochytrium planicorne]